MIVEVLAGLVTDVCLWERPTFKAILKASQWVFEFPRHWGTIFPTCEESARTPLTKWLFSGAELYFYGSKGPVTHFPFFFLIWLYSETPTLPWLKLSLSYAFCNSQNCVILNALSMPCQILSADPCQQRKLPLSYPMEHVGHWLWVQWPQTLWSLSPIQHLFCYIPVSHQLCYVTIFGFSSQPSSLAPCSLSRHLSLSSLFLPWVIISSGFPQSSSRVQRSKRETCWRKPSQLAPD